MNNNFGEARRMYALTTATGRFTQEDASRQLGVSLATIRAWERGATSSFKGERLCEMADLYGVTVDYLLCRAKSPEGHLPLASRHVEDARELEVIRCYRTLQDNGRNVLIKIACSMVRGNQFATR